MYKVLSFAMGFDSQLISDYKTFVQYLESMVGKFPDSFSNGDNLTSELVDKINDLATFIEAAECEIDKEFSELEKYSTNKCQQFVHMFDVLSKKIQTFSEKLDALQTFWENKYTFGINDCLPQNESFFVLKRLIHDEWSKARKSFLRSAESKLFPDYISSKKDASTYLQKKAYCYQLIKDLEASEVSQTQKAQVLIECYKRLMGSEVPSECPLNNITQKNPSLSYALWSALDRIESPYAEFTFDIEINRHPDSVEREFDFDTDSKVDSDRKETFRVNHTVLFKLVQHAVNKSYLSLNTYMSLLESEENDVERCPQYAYETILSRVMGNREFLGRNNEKYQPLVTQLLLNSKSDIIDPALVLTF